MTTTEFKIKMKQALDSVDNGEKLLITRGGKVYEVVRVN
jgi:antitoxin (DNA-binding transcriptional repressor) of toxin-antitoxin stability system